MDYFKLVLLGLITLFAAVASSWGHDLAYQVHAVLIMAISAGLFIWILRGIGEIKPVVPEGEYADGVIRAGVIATAFWGIAGFLVGTYIAFQLAFPALNFEWGQPFTNFGRLRPCTPRP
jgi:cytochrome c oxidase cbb3-type subunit I